MNIWILSLVAVAVVLAIASICCAMIALGAARQNRARGVRACRECGCTDIEACAPFGCYWVDLDLCSACSSEGPR